MKHFKKFLVSFTVGLLMTPPAFAAGDGHAWIVKSDKYRSPGDSYSIKVRVTDMQGDDKKESTFVVASKSNRLTLVEQTEPERQKGRKLLMRDHDLWLFNPNISRPTRISFEQKLTGEVSNGDLMRTNFADDYDAKIAGREMVGKTKTVKLHLSGKGDDITYKSIDYWVNESNSRPVKAVFYALSGKPLKTAEYLEFKTQLGAPRLTKVLITDFIQKNRKSQLIYSNFKRQKFDESYFSKESLSR